MKPVTDEPAPATATPASATIVVRTLNYYGSGATVAAAVKACKAAGGAANVRKLGYVAHRVVGEWTISQIDGSLAAEGAVELVDDARTVRGRKA